MKSIVLIATAVLVLPLHVNAQTITASVSDGGSVVTDLGYNIKVNKGSTLRRLWVVLNDGSCPVQLDGAGINTAYAEREYRYSPTGRAKTSVAISALEVRYLLYDVFGRHMKTLSGTQVTDFAARSEVALSEMGTWRAWENEVSELLTIVAFVAQVRTGDGKIWRYNDKAVGAELDRIQLQVTTGVLEPTKQQ
jgi:hypothetical protein